MASMSHSLSPHKPARTLSFLSQMAAILQSNLPHCGLLSGSVAHRAGRQSPWGRKGSQGDIFQYKTLVCQSKTTRRLWIWAERGFSRTCCSTKRLYLAHSGRDSSSLPPDVVKEITALQEACYICWKALTCQSYSWCRTSICALFITYRHSL